MKHINPVKISLMLLFGIATSSVLASSIVTIECQNGKKFAFTDLMESPEEIGKEKCKDQEGYKKFTAQFSEQGMMGTPVPSSQPNNKK